jgi:hypothetical protein
MKKSTGVKYNPGDLGGRGRHPSDPTGEFYGDKHWPLPLEHEKGKRTVSKYMLIDVTTVERTTLLLIGSGRQAALMGRLLKAQGANVIAPPLEGRGFSKFSLSQLQYLYWNSTGKPPVSDYGELVIACLTAFEEMPVSEVSVEELEAQVAKLAPTEAEGTGEFETATKPATSKQSPKTQGRKAAPSKPGEAPPATSTTGRVWVIADRVLASCSDITATTDWKPIREAIIAACESEGINKATAATQYSKYKASKIAALKS